MATVSGAIWRMNKSSRLLDRQTDGLTDAYATGLPIAASLHRMHWMRTKMSTSRSLVK